jgi:hypothetical protein
MGSSPAIQQQFWQAIHQMADTRSAERVLLVGDFNTGAGVEVGQEERQGRPRDGGNVLKIERKFGCRIRLMAG